MRFRQRLWGIFARQPIACRRGLVEIAGKWGGTSADEPSVMTSPITPLAHSSTRENAWPWGGQLGGRPLRGAASSRGAPLQEVSDPQQVIGQHRRADKHLESFASLEQATP